jgi:PhzF family phenazine biosynthesis protein
MRIVQVDAFTAEPFRGNPAGVCILPGPAGEEWMQAVAREMNLSETAFLVRREDGFDLRWFTPVAEVDLCGHATLASAHVLFETNEVAPGEPARFHTRSGVLTATRKDPWIEMDFPAEVESACEAPEELLRGLDVEPVHVGRNRFDFLVELDSEETLRGLEPDFGLLRTLGARGVMITSRSASPEVDFVSRYFAPAFGIDEDPVTGSAHCCLGPFWAERLGKSELTGYQASARGGVVRVRPSGDRVILGGQAVTVLVAELQGGARRVSLVAPLETRRSVAGTSSFPEAAGSGGASRCGRFVVNCRSR